MAITLEDYLNLIPAPNRAQPKFIEWVGDNIQFLIEIQDVLNDISPEFNLATAVGDQLDIIGQILGLTRQVNFVPSGGFNPIMNDATYRLVLNAKIILNLWKGTKNEIYTFLQAFLPEYTFLILDNQDMTMTVIAIGVPDDITGSITLAFDLDTLTFGGLDTGYFTGFSGFLRQLVTNGYFFPKPAGVAIEYIFSDNTALAFDSDTANLAGLDTGFFII